jgi:phage terminase large subunit-like protein
MIEGRQLLLPYNAVWLPDLVDELLTFPNSRYKDQTDALSQYLNRVRKRTGRLGTKKMRAGAIARAA